MKRSSELVPLPVAKPHSQHSRIAWFDKRTKSWQWRLSNPFDLTWTSGGFASLALALCQSYCHEGCHGEVVPPRADPRGLWVYTGRFWHLVETADISARLDSWENEAFFRQTDKTGKVSEKLFILTSARARAAQWAHEITPRLWESSSGQFDSKTPCLAIGERAYRLDLETFEMIEERLTPEHGARHGFEDLCIESAQAPQWEAYLRQLFDHQEDLIEYLEAWCGFALLGSTTVLQLPALILCGAPGTGKSTLASVISSFFPTSSVVSIPPHLWQEGKPGSGLEMMELARLNVITDLCLTRTISDHGFLKRIIFGETITARPLYQDPISFQPRAAHLWCANGLPQVPGADRALWHRFLPLPVTGAQWRGALGENPFLAQHLREQELSGVLARMLRAACRALKTKREGKLQFMSPPQASLEKRIQWRNEADSVSLWCSERLEDATTLMTSCSPKQGWHDYRQWCQREGYQCCSNRTWSQRMHGLLELEQWPLVSGSRKIPYKMIPDRSNP